MNLRTLGDNIMEQQPPMPKTYAEYTTEINAVELELGRLFMDLGLDHSDAGYSALYAHLGQLYIERQ